VRIAGATTGFLRDGAIITFIRHRGKVRFDIDAEAAANAERRVSSRLLRFGGSPAQQGRP
jgi:hypothetical protein